jgi:hypothetical protein
MNCLIKIIRPDDSYLVIPHNIKYATEAGRCLDGALLAFRAENPHIDFVDVRIEITFERADPLSF